MDWRKKRRSTIVIAGLGLLSIGLVFVLVSLPRQRAGRTQETLGALASDNVRSAAADMSHNVLPTAPDLDTAPKAPDLAADFPPPAMTGDQMLARFFFETHDRAAYLELVRYLSGLPPEEILAKLMPRLDSPLHPDWNRRVLGLVKMIPIKELLPIYEELLDCGDKAVRVSTIQSVRSMGLYSPKIVEKYQQLLESDPDGYVRKEIALFFDEYPEEIDVATASRLAGLVRDPAMSRQPYGKLRALWALDKTSVGDAALVRRLQELYEEGRQRDGTDLALAVAAAGALKRRGALAENTTGFFLRNLKHESEDVRASSIAGLLSAADSPEVRNAVRQALLAEPDITLGEVYRTVGEFAKLANDKELVDAMLAKLQVFSPAQGTTVPRLELASALAKNGREEGIRFLQAVAETENPVGMLRIVALGMMRRAKLDVDYRPFAPPK